MSVNAPFTPTGNTVIITAANPAPTPVQVTSYSGGSNQYRILNAGTVVAFWVMVVTLLLQQQEQILRIRL